MRKTTSVAFACLAMLTTVACSEDDSRCSSNCSELADAAARDAGAGAVTNGVADAGRPVTADIDSDDHEVARDSAQQQQFDAGASSVGSNPDASDLSTRGDQNGPTQPDVTEDETSTTHESTDGGVSGVPSAEREAGSLPPAGEGDDAPNPADDAALDASLALDAEPPFPADEPAEPGDDPVSLLDAALNPDDEPAEPDDEPAVPDDEPDAAAPAEPTEPPEPPVRDLGTLCGQLCAKLDGLEGGCVNTDCESYQCVPIAGKCADVTQAYMDCLLQRGEFVCAEGSPPDYFGACEMMEFLYFNCLFN